MLIDQSGSMLQTDSEGLRADAARFLIDYLALYATEGQDHRVGVVNFGSDARPDQLLRLVSAADDGESLKSRVRTANLGDTNFLAALRLAHAHFAEMGSYEGEAQPAVVILTDGEPDVGSRRGVSLFPEILGFVRQELSPRNCPVYVVAVDSTGSYWPRNAPYWQEIAASTYRISSMAELESVYHHVVADIIGFQWERVAVTPGGGPTRVDVEPYLERVSFTVLKESPQVRLQISRPDGTLVSEGDADVLYRGSATSGRFETYSIGEPVPGTWTLELVEGAGQVQVFRDRLPLAARVIAPLSPYPRGRPMSVVVEFSRRDGSPVEPLPEHPLHVGAAVSAPGKGRAVPVELVADPSLPTRFVSTDAVPADEEGTYSVDVRVKGGDFTILQQRHPVEVRSQPYLSVTAPDRDRIGLRAPLVVRAALLKDGVPTRAEAEFGEDPSGVALVRVGETPDGHTPFVDFMRPVRGPAGDFFEYRLPEPYHVGRYRFDLRLAAVLPSGEEYRSVVETVLVEKHRTVLDRLSLLWVVTLPLGLLSWAMYAAWLRRLPMMHGNVMIDNGEDPVSLSGERRIELGFGRDGTLRLGRGICTRLGYLRGVPSSDEYGRPTVVPSIRIRATPEDVARSRRDRLLLALAAGVLAVAAALYHWTLAASWMGLVGVGGAVALHLWNWRGYDSSGPITPGDRREVGGKTLTFS